MKTLFHVCKILVIVLAICTLAFSMDMEFFSMGADTVLSGRVVGRYQTWKIEPVVEESWVDKYLTCGNLVPVAVGVASVSVSLWSKKKADGCYQIYQKKINPVEIEYWYSQVEKYDKISNISLVFFELSVIWINYKLLKLNLSR